MSEELNRELTKLISKAAIDGTLSESAVTQFTQVLEANKTLTEDLQEAEMRRIENEEALKQSDKLFQETHERLSKYLNREKGLAERESAAEVLQMTVKYERKRVEDHKEMVGLIFRNTVLKKQVMTPTEAGRGLDQYNNPLPGGYAQRDDVEETEA